MKTNIFFIAITLSIISMNSYAQNIRPKTKSDWYISKDVQRINNAKYLSKFKPLTIATVAFPEWTISKGVVKTGRHTVISKQPAGNIVSKGYPVWTISKGVQRMNR
ncbi:MAG: hypothetical protein ACOYXT_17425 [Bacteroidota bacterium]